MNLYEAIAEKQSEIIKCMNNMDILKNELLELKRDVYKKHSKRFKQKPVGKTTIKEDGFEITYNRTEKITLLTEVVNQDKFESTCISLKEKPATSVLSFSKTEFKKLSDDDQVEMEKYLARELNTPTISVKVIDGE